MLSRNENNQNQPPIQLSSDWKEKMEGMVNDAFSVQKKLEDKSFEVFGLIYEKELLITLSYLKKSDDPKEIHKRELPHTLFLSVDYDQQKKNNKKQILTKLIDIGVTYFEHYFELQNQKAHISLDELGPVTWQIFSEDKKKAPPIYYRVGREDIQLSLMADLFLEKFKS